MATYRYQFQIVEPGTPVVQRLIRAAAGRLGCTPQEFAKRATISMARAIMDDEIAAARAAVAESAGEEATNGAD